MYENSINSRHVILSGVIFDEGENNGVEGSLAEQEILRLRKNLRRIVADASLRFLLRSE